MIDSSTSREIPQSEMRVVNKLHRHKKKTRKETRLTVQIREYDMDQVILDLRSDANVLPRQTWESMGKMKLQ